MTTFTLNPFAHAPDLSTKDGRQLFMQAAAPLPEDLRFDGKKENWATFMKHVRAEFDLVCCTQVFDISTKWYTATGGGVEKTAVPERVVNLLQDSTLTTAEVTHHVNIIWEDTVIGGISEIFSAFFVFVLGPSANTPGT